MFSPNVLNAVLPIIINIEPDLLCPNYATSSLARTINRPTFVEENLQPPPNFVIIDRSIDQLIN